MAVPLGNGCSRGGQHLRCPEPYGEPGRRGAQMVTDRVGPAPPIGGAHSGERTGDRNTAWKTAVDVLTSTRSASGGGTGRRTGPKPRRRLRRVLPAASHPVTDHPDLRRPRLLQRTRGLGPRMPLAHPGRRLPPRRRQGLRHPSGFPPLCIPAACWKAMRRVTVLQGAGSRAELAPWLPSPRPVRPDTGEPAACGSPFPSGGRP